MRDKARPKRCEDFCIEMKLAPVDDCPYIQDVGRKAALTAFLTVVKALGRYRIIQKEVGLSVHTTVRLGKESDAVYLMLLDPTLIYRVYRYV